MTSANIRTAALLLLAAGAACRPAEPPRSAAAADSARAEAVRFADSGVARLARGDYDGWTRTMAREVLVFPANPGDALLGPAMVRARLEQSTRAAAQAGVELQINPGTTTVGMDPALVSAWTTTRLDYRLTVAGDTIRFPVRMTTLLARGDSGWRLEAAQFSRPVPPDSLAGAARAKAAGAPAELSGAVSPGADALVQRFRADLSEPGRASVDTAADGIGPGPDDVARGAEAVRALIEEWNRRQRGIRVRPDRIRAILAPGGTSAWVAATFEGDLIAGESSVTVPYRALFGYRRDGTSWVLTQAHIGAAVMPPGR